MRYYRIQQTNREYQFDGDFKLHLPVVVCSTCNRYRSSRFGCPNLNTEAIDVSPYKDLLRISLNEFDHFTKRLATLSDWPLLPGMGFGQFWGRVMKQEKRDFLWIFGRTILIRESAHEALCQEKIKFITGPAIITNSRPKDIRSDYKRIFQIFPTACMEKETLHYTEYKNCPECGLSVLKWPTRVFLEKEKIPIEFDVFGVEEFENIIVNERFKLAVTKHGLTNIEFEPVEIV